MNLWQQTTALWQQIRALFARQKRAETCQQWDEARILKLEKQMSDTVSRADLDAAIKALPDDTAKAVEAAVMPLIQPAIDKMKASPDDFSSELTSLQGVGPAVGAAVAASIAKAFAPPTTPPTNNVLPTPANP